MNISKNLLSLGLIAVISGISTAQTYTATAGTNGVTDIQSNYSTSTGDGASVSVDVPLEFELPKKVAIAMQDSSNIFTTNSLFSPIVPHLQNYATSKIIGDAHSSASLNLMTYAAVGKFGAIYSNTPISVTFTPTDFIHESDPNSIIEGAWRFELFDTTNSSYIYSRHTSNIDYGNSPFPVTINIDDTQLAAAENVLRIRTWSHAYLPSIDATDRAGKYVATANIIVTAL